MKEILVNPDSSDWYERYIEEPVRELVRTLRNNGINTESSCGHDMNIQCQFVPDKQEIGVIYNMVYNYLHEKNLPVNFNIELTIRVMDGHQYPSLIIDLNPNLRIREREEYYALLRERDFKENKD